MDQVKIGTFLKKLRTEKGLTQEQLAAQFNVSGRTVSRWENGNNMPDLSLLIELADFYNVEIRELIDGERKSENMNEIEKETLYKVADYSSEEKITLMRRMHWLFVAGTVGFIAAMVIYILDLDNSPIYDFISGLGLGIAFGMVVFGAIMTSRYGTKMRAAKLRLLKAIRK